MAIKEMDCINNETTNVRFSHTLNSFDYMFCHILTELMIFPTNLSFIMKIKSNIFVVRIKGEKMKEKQRKKCEFFEKHHKDINGRIGSCCGLGGSLIYAVDFFREGSCYYKINEKIEAESMSVADISQLDQRNLLIILRSLVYSLKILHHAKIVHGDLKPDNILINDLTK